MAGEHTELLRHEIMSTIEVATRLNRDPRRFMLPIGHTPSTQLGGFKTQVSGEPLFMFINLLEVRFQTGEIEAPQGCSPDSGQGEHFRSSGQSWKLEILP